MGNDIGGSAGELVQKIHPSMQDTVTGTQKNKGNQSSSYLAPAPVSIHGGWGRTRAYEARQTSLVQSCLVFWTIGSHYRLLREGVISWKDCSSSMFLKDQSDAAQLLHTFQT